MSGFLVSMKMAGLVAAGLALGVGWKLGSYLVDTAMKSENVKKFAADVKNTCSTWTAQESEPLWKRKFNKISEDY